MSCTVRVWRVYDEQGCEVAEFETEYEAREMAEYWNCKSRWAGGPEEPFYADSELLRFDPESGRWVDCL